MAKKSFINKILQNTRKPEGFFGRLVLRGMNRGHASLARWGMGCMEWQADWSVLDIGCGGGANLAQILKRCPAGKAYGIDLSQESVAFARRKNRRLLGTRCFVERGDVGKLPYGDGTFGAVTAFETVYFWDALPEAFAEVARVLKTGGRFLLCSEMSDPANEMWTSRIDGMRVYSAERLETLLAAAGFADIAVYRRKKEELCIVARKQARNDQNGGRR